MDKKISLLISEIEVEQENLLIARNQIIDLQKRLDFIVNSRKWRLMQKIENIFPKNIKAILKLPFLALWETLTMLKRRYIRHKNIHYIRQSGLFDAQWYLDAYRDVKNSKMDPMVHYLDFGAYENRNPGPSFNSALYFQQNPDVVTAKMNPLVHYVRYRLGSTFMFDKFYSKQPFLRFTNFYMHWLNMLVLKSYRNIIFTFTLIKLYIQHHSKISIIILTHDDYLISVGGVEKYIYNEVLQLNINSINAFVLFPDSSGSNFKVVFNNSTILNDINSAQLTFILKIFNRFFNIASYNIHHFFNYRIYDIRNILKIINKQEIVLYLHDIFFINPKLFFTLNSHLDSTKYFDEKGKLYTDITSIFENLFEIAKVIITPSTFLKDTFKKSVKNINHQRKLLVINHLLFKEYKRKPSNTNRRVRIAFLGYQTHFKGYDIFNDISESKLTKDKYDFYSFGNNPKNNKYNNIKNINLGYKREINSDITTLLLNNKIDLVLLWSLLPESYSYTRHEAYSAGIPVLTNTISGNIYESIKNRNIYGKVFNNSNELISFLSDVKKVVKFIRDNKSMIQIISHNSAYIKLLGSNLI